MQFNYFALLALAIASDNGLKIATWVWVVAWVLTILRSVALTLKSIKETR
jgi:hypothetical protein